VVVENNKRGQTCDACDANVILSQSSVSHSCTDGMSDSLTTQYAMTLRLSCAPLSGFEYLLPLTFRFVGGGTGVASTNLGSERHRLS
jgi:hypothetical protein